MRTVIHVASDAASTDDFAPEAEHLLVHVLEVWDPKGDESRPEVLERDREEAPRRLEVAGGDPATSTRTGESDS